MDLTFGGMPAGTDSSFTTARKKLAKVCSLASPKISQSESGLPGPCGCFGSLTDPNSGGTIDTLAGLDVLLNRSGTINGETGRSFVSGTIAVAMLRLVSV